MVKRKGGGRRGVLLRLGRWMEPGLHIKRWLLLLGGGTLFLSLGIAAWLRSLYPLPRYFYWLTLQFVPRPLRAVLFLLVGVGSVALAVWKLNRSLLEPLLENRREAYPQLLYDYRRRGRGPAIVVIGGGHGQSALLRGLKACTANLTAIVTVADDGGSSGRLREELGILPPGDFRNCIAALSDDESMMTRLFQYRFRSRAELNGHSFGNLFISAMAGVTGSFEAALEESSRVLAVRGRVLPSTLEAVTLVADVQGVEGPPRRVYGESRIPQEGGRILRVMLEPEQPRAYPGAVQAILGAEMIVIGPGSLYTSLLPNLLVPEIAEALRATRAPRVYVCNVVTQPGETEGYSAEDHLQALEQHVGTGLFTHIVVNLPPEGSEPPQGSTWVAPEVLPRPGLTRIPAQLGDARNPWQHESLRLADVVMSLLRR